MKTVRKVVSAFLSVLIVVLTSAACLVPAVAEDLAGTCGDQVTWSFDETCGQLTISGTGPMKEYALMGVPYFHLMNRVQSLVVTEGVTSLSYAAFYFFQSMTSVQIAQSVTSIKASAFMNCSGLTSITIPGRIDFLQPSIFQGCTNLQTIKIPRVQNISSDAFVGCTGLKTVMLGSGLIQINAGTFPIDGPALTDVYYTGDQYQWRDIFIADRNGRLNEATKHYNASSYDITVSASSAEGGSAVANDITYLDNETVTLQAFPKSGYVFKGWYCGDSLCSTELTYSFQADAAPGHELVARFEKKQVYTVMAAAVPSTYGSVLDEDDASFSQGRFEEGQQVTLFALPNYGYKFDGWYVDGVKVCENQFYTFTVERETTLYAQFSEKKYTVSVSFEPSDCHAIVGGGGKYQQGTQATVTTHLLALYADAYRFYGWTDENSRIISEDMDYTFTVTKDVSLTAMYVKAMYDVSVVSAGNGSVDVGGYTGGFFEYDESVTVTAVPDAGYKLTGWFDEDGRCLSSSDSYTFTVRGDTVLTARFEKLNRYTVTLFCEFFEGSSYYTGEDNHDYGYVYGGGNYDYGDSVTVRAEPKAGFRFLFWCYENQYGTEVFLTRDAEYTFRIAEDLYVIGKNVYNLYAVFEPIEYYIYLTGMNFAERNWAVREYSYSDENATSGDGRYLYGESVTVTAVPDEHFYFEGWYRINWNLNWNIDSVDLVSNSPSYTFTVTDSDELYAFFYPIEYFVRVTTDESYCGTVSGDGGYSYGETAVVTAEPAEGCSFVGWFDTASGEKVSDDPVYEFTVTGDIRLRAEFRVDTCRITFDYNASSGYAMTTTQGIVDDKFRPGETADVTAVAYDGWHFVGWYEGTEKISDDVDYSFTVTRNITLTAVFESDTVQCTITALAAEGGTASGSGTYPQGALVTLTAVPAPGYAFAGWWYEDETYSIEVTDKAVYTFFLNGTYTLTAKFAPNGEKPWRFDPNSTLHIHETYNGVQFVTGLDPDDPWVSDYVETTGGWSFDVELNDCGCESTGAVLNIYNADGDLVESYAIVMFGDADGNSLIDGEDVMLIKDVVYGKVSFDWRNFDETDDFPQTYCADVNHDYTVDGQDVMMLKDSIGFLKPCNQNWDTDTDPLRL